MATITVRGTATALVAPDRATLDLGVSAVALTSSAALDAVAVRSQQLTTILHELGFADTDWSTQGVGVAEEWEWRKDTNVHVGYRATAGVDVRIVDLDRVAPLLRAAVDDAGAQVRHLGWSVSAAHPARRALLDAAAHDAVQRADTYAAALGLQRGAVDEVSEIPITSRHDVPGAAPMLAQAARGKAADGGDVSISGGEIELAATVDVRFATLPR